MNLQGPGDEATQLKIGTDKKAATKKPWMPASVVKKYKQLYFKFIKAEHLPKMDLMGTIDAYIWIDHMGDTLRTKTVKQEDELVEWDQEMLLPLEVPLSKEMLTFSLYDYDFGTRDELVASMKFSLKEILKTDSSKCGPGDVNYTTRWVNLFGCNPDYAGRKAAGPQNENPDEATTFKGRVLVEYWVTECKHPEMKIRDVTKDDAYQTRLERMKEKQYHIQAEIGSGICLPASNDYQI